MTKQNKNRKNQTTLGPMAASGSQIVLMKEDCSEQPIDEINEFQPALCDYPFDKDFHYENWWNRFRGPWLKSENMTEDEIKTRADDAWKCGDYKEMITLMTELICRLEARSK